MKMVGRYVVEAELGAGAMGTVYMATDSRLNRRVALKTCRVPDGISAERRREFEERFVREARAAAALAHPGIVTVYDADVDAEQSISFIAMELVDGKTLAEMLAENGRLELDHAVAVASSLAEALDVAHDAGIVHRDVKPANVLVRESDGTVKVTDFGVARLPDSDLTRTQATLGSPAYMSPEQIRGDRVDGRSDLFSLAVILYEMLCGRRPFLGDDLTALAYAIAHDAHEPITGRCPELPIGLDRFFERALAKDPERRFSTGKEFGEALSTAIAESSALEPIIRTLADVPSPSAPPDKSRVPIPDLADVPPLGFTDPETHTRRPRVWALGVIGCLVALTGWWAFADAEARLRLEGRSTIESGTLTILIDGDPLYTRELSAPQPTTNKGRGKGVFRKINDALTKRNQESFEAWIEIPAGEHQLTATVEPAGLRDSIVVDLESGEERTLRLAAGKAFGSPISMYLD